MRLTTRFLLLVSLGLSCSVGFVTLLGGSVDIFSSFWVSGKEAWGYLVNQNIESLFGLWLEGAFSLFLFAVLGLPAFLMMSAVTPNRNTSANDPDS